MTMKFFVMTGLIASVCLLTTLELKAQEKASSGALTVHASTLQGPAEGAIVLLRSQAGKQRLGVINTEGAFRFSHLAPDVYTLKIVYRAYFIAPELEQRLSSIKISTGEERSLEVRLIKGGVISGRLLSQSSNPLVGLPVTALRLDPASGKPNPPLAAESNVISLSDDRGAFRIHGLREGKYVLGVNVQRASSQLKSVPTLYYPGQSTVKEATVFDVSPNQVISVTDMTIDVNKRNQASLSVRIVGNNDTPLEGVPLTLVETTGSQLSDFGETDQNGSFTFEALPRGTYSVKCNPGKAPYFSTEKVIVLRDSVPENITLELRGFPTITGNTYIRRNKETTTLPALEINLMSAKTALRFASEENGSFTIQTAANGYFWWQFPQLSPDTYVERITLDGRDVTHKPLHLDRLSDRRGISVILANEAATINGRFDVANREACSLYSVFAVAINPTGTEILHFKRANECDNNAFRIHSLAPGKYYLVALAYRTGVEATPKESRFHGIDDRDTGLVQNLIARLETEESNRKALNISAGQHYAGKIPLLVAPTEKSGRDKQLKP